MGPVSGAAGFGLGGRWVSWVGGSGLRVRAGRDPEAGLDAVPELGWRSEPVGLAARGQELQCQSSTTREQDSGGTSGPRCHRHERRSGDDPVEQSIMISQLQFWGADKELKKHSHDYH